MSTRQEFYATWGAFAVLLLGAVLFAMAAPIRIVPYVLIEAPVLIGLWVWGAYFVRCGHCGVALFDTVRAHGLPGQHCPECTYDLMARHGQPASPESN